MTFCDCTDKIDTRSPGPCHKSGGNFPYHPPLLEVAHRLHHHHGSSFGQGYISGDDWGSLHLEPRSTRSISTWEHVTKREIHSFLRLSHTHTDFKLHWYRFSVSVGVCFLLRSSIYPKRSLLRCKCLFRSSEHLPNKIEFQDGRRRCDSERKNPERQCFQIESEWAESNECLISSNKF
jgi:hypothetical protein